MSREVPIISIYQACRFYSSKDGVCNKPYLGESPMLVDEINGGPVLLDWDGDLSTSINPINRRKILGVGISTGDSKLYCGAVDILLEKNPGLIGRQIYCCDYLPERANLIWSNLIS